MKPYQLKRDILYSAIQGKLVEQNVSEGLGSELLKRNLEKITRFPDPQRKKIEKQNKPFTEADFLFDIPQNWSWARFGSLVINYDNQRRPVTKSDRKTTHGIYDYYGATGAIDKVDEYIFDGEYLMIGEDGGNFFVDRDNSFIAKGKFWANNHVHVVKPIACDIQYLKVCLDAYDLPNMGLINGIAVPKLNQENLNSIMIPIPPLAEQKRIVAKIEELLPLIDRYEKAWTRLEEFNKRFPDDLQKSLLQMAIQGKLVEQRSEEGTGEELYQQIQKEKQELIRAGKIKKEKPLPEITEDEKPFDVPNSWHWVRLSEVCNVSDGTHQTPKYVDKGMPFISAQNIKPYRFLPEIHRDVSYEDYLEYNKLVAPHKGDILMTRVGAGIGEAAIIDQDFEFAIYVSLTLIKQYGNFQDMKYILNVLNSPLGKSLASRKTLGKGASQGNLNLVFIREFAFPLPPLAEQKRIVVKLEELLPLCEKLKS